MQLSSRQWHLARRPQGFPVPEDFSLHTVVLPEPAEGEVAVVNELLSVDPYMRGRMNDRASYAPPYRLGEVMYGGAVGRVVASRHPEVPEGALVRSNLGWREAFVAPAGEVEVLDAGLAGPGAWLGVLGMPGLTAWVGLYDIAELRPGETVFVSAAAGAVGAVACQLARASGARVIGSAGTAEKVAWLTDEAGVDAAFDYHDRDVGTSLSAALRHLGATGVDVYFDNVGGDHLRAALACMNPRGRVAACGMISSYNTLAPGPENLFEIVARKLTVRGFIVSDHAARAGLATRHIAALLARGELRYPQTVVEGITEAPRAFLDLLRGGRHLGKMLVRVAPLARSDPSG